MSFKGGAYIEYIQNSNAHRIRSMEHKLKNLAIRGNKGSRGNILQSNTEFTAFLVQALLAIQW